MSGGLGRLFAKTGRLDASCHRELVRAQEVRLVVDHLPLTQVPAAQAIHLSPVPVGTCLPYGNAVGTTTNRWRLP
jgi:hypothetical protein